METAAVGEGHSSAAPEAEQAYAGKQIPSLGDSSGNPGDGDHAQRREAASCPQDLATHPRGSLPSDPPSSKSCSTTGVDDPGEVVSGTLALIGDPCVSPNTGANDTRGVPEQAQASLQSAEQPQPQRTADASSGVSHPATHLDGDSAAAAAPPGQVLRDQLLTTLDSSITEPASASFASQATQQPLSGAASAGGALREPADESDSCAEASQQQSVRRGWQPPRSVFSNPTERADRGAGDNERAHTDPMPSLEAAGSASSADELGDGKRPGENMTSVAVSNDTSRRVRFNLAGQDPLGGPQAVEGRPLREVYHERDLEKGDAVPMSGRKKSITKTMNFTSFEVHPQAASQALK